MKKLITFLVFLLVLTCAISVFADYQTVEIYVNGELLVSDAPAILYNSRTMVPLRAISEKLGCDVGWDDATQTAEIKNDKTAVYVTIESDVLVKKDIETDKNEEIKIDAPAMLYKSRTLIPLRAVSEALDAIVDWDSEKECALITTAGNKTYYGVVTENGYISDELGIEFVTPEGAVISRSEDKKEVSQWTDDVATVDAETVEEFTALFKYTRSNLTFAVSPKTSVEPEEYLEYMKESLETAPSDILFIPSEKLGVLDVGGYSFKSLDLAVFYSEEGFNMKYCAGKINDRLVIMLMVYGMDDQTDISEFLQSFAGTK